MRKLSDPVAVDHWIDVTSVTMWGILTCWSLLYMLGAIVHGTLLVSNVVGHTAALAWAATLAVACATSAVCAARLVIASSEPRRLRAARIEQAAAVLAVCLAASYVIWELARLVDAPSFAAATSFVLALFYPLWPTWRIHDLAGRISSLRAVIAAQKAGGA